MTFIGVINQSTRVTSDEVYQMVVACDYQARYHAAPHFGMLPPAVAYLKDPSQAPPGAWVISVLDNADQAGDLGWHTEAEGGLIYGRVFAGPVLDNGGVPLNGQLSVCSVLSHEILESLADPHCNMFCDAGTGTAYAYEVGDPVEDESYPVTISAGTESITATVSNFVLPAWFDPDAAKLAGAFDYMGTRTAPFQLSPGGYVILMTEGNVTQQFGEHYPEWKRDAKKADTARTSRFLSRPPLRRPLS